MEVMLMTAIARVLLFVLLLVSGFKVKSNKAFVGDRGQKNYLGQTFRPGKCPTVNPVYTDWSRMRGAWYFMARSLEFNPFLRDKKCMAEVKVYHQNGTLSVFASDVSTRTGECTQNFFAGLIVPDPYQPGELRFVATLETDPDYKIFMLDVDTNSHHLIYNCIEGGPDKKWSIEKAWIFTRTRRPLSKALKHRLYRILKDNNISPEYMIPIDQTNCPPHPTHDTSRPD